MVASTLCSAPLFYIYIRCDSDVWRMQLFILHEPTPRERVVGTATLASPRRDGWTQWRENITTWLQERTDEYFIYAQDDKMEIIYWN